MQVNIKKTDLTLKYSMAWTSELSGKDLPRNPVMMVMGTLPVSMATRSGTGSSSSELSAIPCRNKNDKFSVCDPLFCTCSVPCNVTDGAGPDPRLRSTRNRRILHRYNENCPRYQAEVTPTIFCVPSEFLKYPYFELPILICQVWYKSASCTPFLWNNWVGRWLGVRSPYPLVMQLAPNQLNHYKAIKYKTDKKSLFLTTCKLWKALLWLWQLFILRQASKIINRCLKR